MGSFIDEYLRNPANAVASARECAGRKSWKIDDDLIYKELASPEFRLYEEMVLSSWEEETFVSGSYAAV